MGSEMCIRDRDDSFDSNDLATAPITNPDDNGETPSTFPDDDAGQAGGEPDWRDDSILDTDGDGIGDADDLDDDNDGILDVDECSGGPVVDLSTISIDFANAPFTFTSNSTSQQGGANTTFDYVASQGNTGPPNGGDFFNGWDETGGATGLIFTFTTPYAIPATTKAVDPVSYTHLTLPTIYSV